MTLRQAEVIAPSSADPAIERAVAAARRLTDSLLRSATLEPQVLESVADRLESLAARLDADAPSPAEVVAGLDPGEFYSRHDPIAGVGNPFAPPVRVLGLADGSVAGSARLGLPYQGPPGLVHGGISAMILDHVLALANSWAGTIGMTGRLELRYLRPTPLFAELDIRARQVEVQGRRITTTGEISVDGERCVQATGIFVTFPDPGTAPAS